MSNPLSPKSDAAIAGERRVAFADLTTQPIDLAALRDRLDETGGGAVVSFDGVVRAEANAAGEPLAALEYSAHESMARDELSAIARQAAASSGVLGVAVMHRLGTLRVGESSIGIVVCAAHRAEAFDACREVIEQVKVRVPIFKREVWLSGSRTWVNDVDA